MKALDIFSRLIAYPTESSRSNQELIHFIADYLESFRFRVHFFPSATTEKQNLYAILGPECSGGFMFAGHTDVVPVANQNWTVEPFQLTEKENRFYGRGTADMKGFIAQILSIVPHISSASLKYPLILAFTYDEEVGCLGASQLMQQLSETSLPKPAQAIVGEPSGFIPFRLHKGMNLATISIKGIPGHSSKPERGVSAIEIAGDILQFLKNMARELQQKRTLENLFEVPYSTLNIGQIRGGTAHNIIASDCFLEVEFRSMPDSDPLYFYHQLIDYLKQDWKWKTRGGEVKVDLKQSLKPMMTPENNQIQHLVLKHALGPKCLAAPYYTEGAIYNEAGIESIIFGPGNIDQAHREDEFISAEDFFRGIPIWEQIIHERLR
ncbi:MAG: acetylornithine deacetylase [Planctomycetota bacterium]